MLRKMEIVVITLNKRIPWVVPLAQIINLRYLLSDGRNLYIQCFLSYNDTLSTDFHNSCVNFLITFDDEDSHFLPDETMNKLFTGADGETLTPMMVINTN